MSNAFTQIKDLFANFQSGQLLGVDISTSAVKICLLSSQRKSFKIEKFLVAELPEGAIIEEEIEKPEEISALISELLKSNKIETKIACLGIDGSNTFLKRVQIPLGSKEDLEDTILWEAEQYVPFSAEESELDYVVIGSNKEMGTQDVILASVKTNAINKYSKILTDAGLIIKVIDLKVLALSNVFELYLGKELKRISEEGAVVLDLGAQKTSVLVYKDGGPILTKEIMLGSSVVTEEIQRRMGVSFVEAEDLKVNGAISGNYPEDVAQIIQEKNNEIVEEIKKVINFYIAPGSAEQINHCFITGGASQSEYLRKRLEDELLLPVNNMSLLESISYTNRAIIGQSVEYVNCCGAIAIGLAMRKS